MSARRKAASDWRCHGEPVFRDVAPGFVPVMHPDEDGNPWLVLDVDARLVQAVEQLARKKRRGFASIVEEIGLAAALRRREQR